MASPVYKKGNVKAEIIKRDGRKVEFDRERIEEAILKAMISVLEATGSKMVDPLIAGKIAAGIGSEVSNTDEDMTVEQIQDMVEVKLMKEGLPQVAKAYILYRDKRTKARNSKSDQVIADIVAAEKNEVTRENANMNASTPAGMMYKIGSERSKEYTYQYLLSEEAKRYIDANFIHVHDMDHYALRDINCLQHPLDRILKEGFAAGHGESRPAKRIETASIMACISLETIQNEMFGGQSIPAFDFYMAPYVRKTYIEELKSLEALCGDLSRYYNADIKEYTYVPILRMEGYGANVNDIIQYAINRTVSRVHQAMEALVHNLNQIHSRGGNQVTFSSLNYGTDTSPEGRCVIRELLLTTERGVGNGKTAIFPIQVFLRKEGVNKKPCDPNYDLYELACRVTALRYFPNFLNLDTTYNKDPEWKADDPERYKHQVYTMGCVDGGEGVDWTYRGFLYKSDFETMWNHFSKEFEVKRGEEEGYDCGEFIDLSGVGIADLDSYVECKRIIKNPDKGNWRMVYLSGGLTLACTADHPWSLINEEVLPTYKLKKGDRVLSSEGHRIIVERIVALDNYNQPSYDVTTSSEHFNVSGIRSHNCRTRVYEDRFGPRTSIGRGNLSFTTINLPGLALSVLDKNLSEGEQFKKFMDKLHEVVGVVGRQLHDRYKLQCQATVDQFPMLMGGHWVGSENLKSSDKVEEVLKHGTLGVGFIGLAECLIALLGKHHGESIYSQKLGLKIVSKMHEWVKGLANEYDLNYSLFATPAEGLSGKFTRKDKKLYPIVPGVNDKDYYTNSSHVPVYYKCTPSHKFEVEGPYHKFCTGGHIGYIELDGDPTKNIEAVKQVVELGEKNDIGYISINHWAAECPICGHRSHSHQETICPKCGIEMHLLERITGYLVGGSALRWNEGKLAELKDRVAHGEK